MTTQNEVQDQMTETETTSSPQSEEISTDKDPLFEEPDFAAITEFVDGNGEEVPVAVQTEEAETPVEEEPPQEELAAEPESEAVVPTEEEPETPAEEVAAAEEEPEPEPEVAAEPEPEPEPIKLPTAEELEGLYTEHREKTLPQLAEMFVLSEEDAAALDEQPSKAIPKLAGQMMYDTMLSTYNAVLTALPTVVQAQMASARKAEAAQEQFYAAWPDLNNEKARPAVSAAVHAYRAANPRAGLQEVIKQSGVMAMLNLGLDPTKVNEKSKPKPARRAAPAKPAGAGHSTQQTAPNPAEEVTNMFDALTQAIQDEMN
jgi:hypothetical protein